MNKKYKKPEPRFSRLDFFLELDRVEKEMLNDNFWEDQEAAMNALNNLIYMYVNIDADKLKPSDKMLMKAVGIKFGEKLEKLKK